MQQLQKKNWKEIDLSDWAMFKGYVNPYIFGSKTKKYATLHRNRAQFLGISVEEYTKLAYYQRHQRVRQKLASIWNDQILRDKGLEIIKKQKKEKEKTSGVPIHKIYPEGNLTSNGWRLMTETQGYRLRVGDGGARAGKTYYITQEIVEQCLAFEPGKLWAGKKQHTLRVYIGGVTFGIMEGGCIQDFINVMKEAGEWDAKCWKSNDHIYKFPNGAIVDFFTYKTREDPPGLECQIYFFNEANHAPFRYFDQIRRRCTGYGWLDFNPTVKFWYHDKIEPYPKEYGLKVVDGINYLGNESLTPTQIANIEADQVDPTFWNIFGKGVYDANFRLCFKPWEILEPTKDATGEITRDVPHEAVLLNRGLDWGGQAPRSGLSYMAVVAAYSYKGGYLLDQELYQQGITDEQVARFLINRPFPCPIIADMRNLDSSMARMVKMGVRGMRKTSKGAGSVIQSIKFMNDHPIWVTERSVDLIREHSRYVWAEDNRGDIDFKLKPNPRCRDDAIDAARYSLEPEYLKASPLYNTDVKKANTEFRQRIFQTPKSGSTRRNVVLF